MNKIFFIAIISYLIFGAGIACTSADIQDHSVKSRNFNAEMININSDRTNQTVENADSLCNKLDQIKRIPYEDIETAGDLIYDGLKETGNRSIPCLINKITDTTPMNDPREDTHVTSYTVGDTAVMLLLIITKENPKNMLPAEYSKYWETEGIYAYFAYVKNAKNRAVLKTWWEKWENRNLQ